MKPARKPLKLPGIVIDFENQCVDLEATVCLTDGLLELVACTKGSKEHESIVAVSARPMHIHTALLLTGANNGHPAMRRSVDKQNPRWVNLPPQGDPIEVFLLLPNQDGILVEHPIRDFIVGSDQAVDEVEGKIITASDPSVHRVNEKQKRLPGIFLFAGSHLRDNETGARQYLADVSGHVISIATFGDELLCLPSHQTQKNNALNWQIEPGTLPKVGTRVTLRLRPHLATENSANTTPKEAPKEADNGKAK